MVNYDETLMVKVSKTFKGNTRAEADRRGVSLSEFVRSVIQEKIEDRPLTA